MLDLIFLIIVLIYLITASLYDIKTREVPDFLSYSLLAIALFFSLSKSIYFLTFSFILQSLFGMLIFLLLSFILYYSKQWGGGDAKLLIALGASFPVYPEILLQYFSPNLSMPFQAILLINLAVFGSLYSILYAILVVIKNHSLKNFNKKYLILLYLSLLLFVISFFLEITFSLLLILVALLALYPFLYHFIKIFEKNFMNKTIPLSKVTEGDWLTENVYKNKKLILSKNLPGLTLQDIKRLKSLKIKQVKIKYGMPFIPSFLIAFIISLIIGSLI
ncbi:prepilin peptidase [Candidatus Woesearchaeota archaeon]|nr:prepilin peptidase [Candidatus Woesearchaeota archaeon]